MIISFKSKISILICSTLCFLAIVSKAQLTVSNTMTPTQLVQNVLLGGGVTASNITFNGVSVAAGSFNGTSSNIGFSSGVILATGDVGVAVGPNNSGSLSNGGSGSSSTDPELTSIATNTLYDATILEFDFVPVSDTVKFRYVFASEEYPEYVCSNYNDVFGFFISGPNPAGGTYTNKNIAIIPTSAPPLAVAINSVNPGVAGSSGTGTCTSLAYSSLYFDNQTPPGTSVQYDGFTVPLTAISAVNCGQTYHIKIAIADVGDAAFDSGVFLEAGSFSSVGVTIVPEISYGGSNDSTLYEGCGTACIHFIRTSNLSQADTITVNIGGSAINGVDYNTGVVGVSIPTQLIFLAGQDSVSYCINAVSDGITEGLDTITLAIVQTGPCQSLTTRATIYLNEYSPMALTTSDTILCNTLGPVTLLANVTGGVQPYTYSWTNGAAAVANPTVNPASTTNYVLTVNDACMGSPDPTPAVIDSAKVTIISIPAITSVINSGAISASSFYEGCGQACFYFVRTINIGAADTFNLSVAGTATNGVDYTTLPTQLFFVAGQDSLKYCVSTTTDAIAETNETIALSISLTGACNLTSNNQLTIVDPLPLTLSVSNDTILQCQTSSISMFANVNGGVAPYTYSWTNGAGNISNPTVTPPSTTTYVVSVSDNCNGSPDPTPLVSDSVKITIVTYTPLVINAGNDVNVCPGDLVNLLALVTGGGTPYIYNWTTFSGTGVLTSTNTAGTSLIGNSTGVFQVTVMDVCGAIENDQVEVTVEPSCEISIPNVITPDGSGPITNEIFYIENLDKFPNSELQIFNRWGKKVYESASYLNNWNGGKLTDGTYYYVLTVPASGQVLPKLKPTMVYDINVKSETGKRSFAGYFQIIREK